mgnify:FL=1
MKKIFIFLFSILISLQSFGNADLNIVTELEYTNINEIIFVLLLVGFIIWLAKKHQEIAWAIAIAFIYRILFLRRKK